MNPMAFLLRPIGHFAHKVLKVPLGAIGTASYNALDGTKAFSSLGIRSEKFPKWARMPSTAVLAALTAGMIASQGKLGEKLFGLHREGAQQSTPTPFALWLSNKGKLFAPNKAQSAVAMALTGAFALLNLASFYPGLSENAGLWLAGISAFAVAPALAFNEVMHTWYEVEAPSAETARKPDVAPVGLGDPLGVPG